MGATYLASWTAFSDRTRHAIVAAEFAVFTFAHCIVCSGQAVTGVVYSNHSGPSANASGMVELAVDGRMLTLFYGSPALSRSAPPVCHDIGAVWTVETRADNGSTVMVGYAACSGKVDTVVHDAWLLFRRYVETLKRPPRYLFSPRWRASPEFSAFVAAGKRIDASFYARLDRAGCVDVLGRRGGALLLRAGVDCALTVDGRPVELRLAIEAIPVRGSQIDNGEIRPIGPDYR